MKVWSIAFAALCGLALTGLAHGAEPLPILSSMERSDTPSKTRRQHFPNPLGSVLIPRPIQRRDQPHQSVAADHGSVPRCRRARPVVVGALFCCASRPDRVLHSCAPAHAERSTEGPCARTAETAEGVPTRLVLPWVRAPAIAPSHHTLAEVHGIDAERVADVAEGTRPADVVGEDPLLSLAVQPPPPAPIVEDVALQGRDGFFEDGQQQALFGNMGRVGDYIAVPLEGRSVPGSN